MIFRQFIQKAFVEPFRTFAIWREREKFANLLPKVRKKQQQQRPRPKAVQKHSGDKYRRSGEMQYQFKLEREKHKVCATKQKISQILNQCSQASVELSLEPN